MGDVYSSNLADRIHLWATFFSNLFNIFAYIEYVYGCEKHIRTFARLWTYIQSFDSCVGRGQPEPLNDSNISKRRKIDKINHN